MNEDKKERGDGVLYVVGTPIGNLEDISLRGIRVLREADLVAAEDTRHTGVLLKHLEIDKPMLSYHKFNEAQRKPELFDRIRAGQKVALVSDAGMPGISDPGERLIRECRKEGLLVEVVPGASAVLHSVVASGMRMTPFYFGGFLPYKGAARRKELQAALARKCTSVYFESPHRLISTLEECLLLAPEGQFCVARELTKKFEEVIKDRPEALLERFRCGKVKGEITFIVEGQ